MEQSLPPDVEQLIEQLKSPDPIERMRIVQGLAKLDCHDERVHLALEKVAWDDPDVNVRSEARYALGKLGFPVRAPDGWVPPEMAELTKAQTPAPAPEIPAAAPTSEPYQPEVESQPAGWLKWVSSGLPLTLGIVGGLLGGVIGIIAGFINLMIVQSRLSAVLKYVLTVLVIVLAFGIYVVAAVGVNQVFSGQRTPVPTEFKSVEGGFMVTAPDQLVESEETEQTEAGKITIHNFVADLGDAAFLVTYLDYPGELVESQSPESFLDAGLNGALSVYSSSEMLSLTSITLDGYPGRELQALFEEDEQTIGIQVRAYLVANRMYMVMVAAPEKVEHSERTRVFFESFRLLGE